MAFCEPDTCDRFLPEEQESQRTTHVAALRSVCARLPNDAGLKDLVSRLQAASPEFARLWQNHDVRMHHRLDRKTVRHPAVGWIDLDCEVLLMPERDQRMIVLSAQRGTPDYEALRLLGVVGLQDLAAG
jgi:hypothetical protein